MVHAHVKNLLCGSLVATACGLALFWEYIARASSPSWLYAVLVEMQAAYRDPQTQWMVVLCLTGYLATSLFLKWRSSSATNTQRWRNPDWWLSAMLILALSRYAFAYEVASSSMQPLVLLAGILLGKGATFWVHWRDDVGERERWGRWLLGCIIFLLAIAAMSHPGMGTEYQYRGGHRWTGVWDNPNTYGVLMGVGFILTAGQVLSLVTRQFNPSDSRGNEALEPNPQDSKGGTQSGVLSRWLKIIFFLFAAGVTSVGLVNSYSRGAWVATLCGLGYLAWNALKCQVSSVHPPQFWYGGRVRCQEGNLVQSKAGSWIRRNWISLASFLIALVVIAFWNFRHTERVVVRRALSVGNVNDFSWRNRVAAWGGALQMMSDKPWLGFGWNQPQQVYERYYRPAKVDEGAAIQMNDHLMLGMMLGLPALVCFAFYLALALRAKCRVSGVTPQNLSPVTRHASLPTICRAGAVVLLVGFWFDGGLLKLATGATFWILLELGREDADSKAES